MSINGTGRERVVLMVVLIGLLMLLEVVWEANMNPRYFTEEFFLVILGVCFLISLAHCVWVYTTRSRM